MEPSRESEEGRWDGDHHVDGDDDADLLLFYGLSYGPKWTFLPVHLLLVESLALWIITRQLHCAFLTAFDFFACGSILVAYRLTFLEEVVELLPGGVAVGLKRFAEVDMYASMWLILLVGLALRTQGGAGYELMRKYDVTGIFLVIYGLVLVVMKLALLRELMPCTRGITSRSGGWRCTRPPSRTSRAS